MKNVIKFLTFLIYSTCIFFIPNQKYVLFFVVINLMIIFFSKINIKHILNSTLNILPFVIFTFIINLILDDFENSIWIGIKLLIVCNITIIYSNTTDIVRNC